MKETELGDESPTKDANILQRDESSPLSINIIKLTEEVASDLSSPPPSPLPMPTVDTPMQNSVIRIPELENPIEIMQ